MALNFLEELEWRGMLQDMTPGIKEELEKGMVTGYIGFDPTAPSLTIGNYVQIMLLTLFQRAGNKPVVLMGGATGRIGDPSGKDKERDLKSYEELDSNLKYQAELFAKFLDFENGENKAVMVNNYDFYKEMNALDFLRTVGKTLTVNYMMSKESVKNRIERGISFTEFSYQLLQGYDFQCLYEQMGCSLQMGGSDQWGNITTGTEFVRRNLNGKAYAVTTPLLTKADGSKFGKSEKGNIWIDRKFTSPYAFYQFWIDCDDRDLPKFIRYFTLKSKEEVEALEAEYTNNINGLKKILAEELTERVYSRQEYEEAERLTQLLWGKKTRNSDLADLTGDQLQMIADGLDSFSLPGNDFSEPLGVIDLLASKTGICASNGDARRAIKGNAISINKEKLQSHAREISAADFLHDKFLLVENGKKHKYMIVKE